MKCGWNCFIRFVWSIYLLCSDRF